MAKPWIERYAESVDCYNLAVTYFESAERHFAAGNYQKAREWMHQMYIYLLEAEEAKYIHDSSPKQIKQRQLFTELGTLHRTRANIKSIIRDCAFKDFNHNAFYAAIHEIDKLISSKNFTIKNL